MKTFSPMMLALFGLVVILAGCQPVQPSPSEAAVVPEVATLPADPTQPCSEEHPEWGVYFEERHVEGAVVLHDGSTGCTLRYNPQLAAQAFLPASTFKIPNTLIGLQSGVISGADMVMTWDGRQWPIESWNQDHDLRSAFQNSVVWYYQELARRVGAERMRSYVESIPYGNADIGGEIDTFWLEGELRISPDQQVEFLRRLQADDLPFSTNHQALVRELMILEETPEYTLRAKTGYTARVKEQVGWWVGYVEKDGVTYTFATLLHMPEPVEMFQESRIDITREVLMELEILPGDTP